MLESVDSASIARIEPRDKEDIVVVVARGDNN
jgi:hypothetical protein